MNAGKEDAVRLFAYGTLRDPEVQRAVFGREPASETDALTGFRLGEVSIDGKTYRTLRRAADRGERIDGLALQLGGAELASADAYEGDTDYVRIAVRLESGCDAFVYVSASG